MSELAERAIEHELAAVGLELERKLEATARLLRPYRREELEAAVEEFARAEVEEEDPLRSRNVPKPAGPKMDPLGVGAVFADPVE